MNTENKKCGDSWTVEVIGENHPSPKMQEWGPIGPTTASLEEATDWLITCSMLNTKAQYPDPATGFLMDYTLQFRLHNLSTDEIIPMEILIGG